ncbi:MAG: flavin-containing monooxygenase [Geminicoccales bacterium]
MDAVLEDPARLASDWLERLQIALSHSSSERLEDLFLSDGYWRDALALTWSLQTFIDGTTIADHLWSSVKAAGLASLRLDLSAPAPQHVERVGRSCVEAFFTLETTAGLGRGIVRLIVEGDQASKAWTLLTALEGLKGHEETIGADRPIGQSYSRDFRGPNWLDGRLASQAYADRDPTVLVVGGGQAGLSIAARLTQLGVDTLIIDRHERIGDNWRKRYHALTLHNQVHVNHLPYMPFPPNWPVYIPKDKLANWFEFYVEAMELNFWTGNELVEAVYDDASGTWSAALRRADGSVDTLHPRHIVMASGVSGIPNRPELPGLGGFRGEIVHSNRYGDGERWRGKSAVVIGTGNSGHDIAQDLASSGADVTLVQRSSTLIVSIEPSAQLPYVLYDGSRSLEDTDLIAVSMPMPLMREAHVGYTKRSRELDADLLAKLEAIGFKLDPPEDHAGWQFKYLTRGGGYYFNVGCSDMLIEGRIKLLQFSTIDSFTRSGLCLKDGGAMSADLIVLATGYKPQEDLVENVFGTEVKERVGPIWGFGDELELRNMYNRTGQPGLWFIAGSFAQCRINSKFLALQIKACEEGMIPLEKPCQN